MVSTMAVLTVSPASTFGARLREMRKRSGLTQKTLASLAGIPQSRVAAYESDTNEPSWSAVIALAAALGVSPNDFLAAGSEPAGE